MHKYFDSPVKQTAVTKPLLNTKQCDASNKWYVRTCMNACMLLKASLGDERLLAEVAVKSLERVVERPVHFQAVLGGKALPADLTAVRPHPCVVQHMNTERVQLGHRLATDVTHELSLGAVLRRVVRSFKILCDR